MSADADDLFERAGRAEARDIPTLDELTADLAQALDEIEGRFPNGKPRRDGSGLDRLEYQTLMLRITNLRRGFEHYQYTETPREVLQVEASVRDVRWEMFVEAHPELTAPATFTDEELLDALRVAIETKQPPWSRGAASSSCVVSVLLPHERGAKTSIRIGKALARLAREGQIVRLRQKWSKGRGSSIWSFHGSEIGEYWLKGYEVEDA